MLKYTSHHTNTSVLFRHTYSPLLYCKTGIYKGKHYFSIFALERRLWALVMLRYIKTDSRPTKFCHVEQLH